MKANKYNYSLVIQQFYTGAYGWEDVSEYPATSTGKCIETTTNASGRKISLCKHDANEYRASGYPTRVIFRRTLNKQD